MGMRTWLAAVLTCAGLLLFSVLTASAQDIRAGVEQLASQIDKASPEGKQLRVAVADFPDLQGVTSDFGRYVASRLTTRLAQSPKFFVIERQRLGQVLAELKFGMSDLVDPAKAKQLGLMVGVEAILVGTVSDLGNQVDLDARMIEIETNRMLLGATVTISKDPTVTAMLERGRQETVAAPEGLGAPSAVIAAPAPQSKAVQRVEFEWGVADLKNCTIAGTTVRCDFTVTNKTYNLSGIYIWASQTTLYDDLGNEYHAERAALASKIGEYVEHTFAPQVVTPARLEFKGVSSQASKAVVLIIKFGGTSTTIEFRDVPLQR